MNTIVQREKTMVEGLTDLPIILHMDTGHTDPLFELPYGVQAEIDCASQQFTISEIAV